MDFLRTVRATLTFTSETSPLKRTGKWLLVYIVIGTIAGLGSILFHTLCELGMHFFLDGMAGYRPSTPAGEHALLPSTDTPFSRWILLILPALGGLVSGWLVYTYAPEAEGHGTDSAIDAYHNKGGQIRGRVPIIKTVASAITLTTGGSGGREGPIAQIGAGFGSFLGNQLGLSERERRIMLAAGVAAGVGSIFRAPMAGALFAAEVLYREPEFESEVIIPAGIASAVAYCLFCLVFGWGSLFDSPDFTFTNPLELGPYTLLAIILSAGGYLYVKCFHGVRDLFRKIPIKNHFKPAIGGLLTGGIGFFLPQTLAFGYGVVQQGLHGELGIPILLGVALGKILTTSFTISSGGSGGVFGPSVVIGGALGGAVGQMVDAILPNLINPGAFIIVGMAGFFTAVSNTPVSTIIFVSEMTGSYNLLLPSLLVCFLCQTLAQKITIYVEQYSNKLASPAHAGEFFVDILQSFHVQDLMGHLRKFVTVPENMPFAKFKEFFSDTSQDYFPVVNDRNELTGIFTNRDIRTILFETEVDDLIVVKDLATTDLITTTPEEDLGTVMTKFTQKNLDCLPVLDSNNPTHLLGMLRRREVIAFYNNELARMKPSEE